VGNNLYNINYRKWVTWLIPVPLRGGKMLAWCMALVGPVIAMYNQLLLFRDACIYKLTITPQVVFLEKALNDRYDQIARRIFITDLVEYEPIYLYLKAESKAHFFYRKSEAAATKTYLYTRAETGKFGVDFIINIPVAVSFDAAELKAFVSTYKLASKIFKVKIV
jgi:hypothetical protein